MECFLGIALFVWSCVCLLRELFAREAEVCCLVNIRVLIVEFVHV
jgi:hypothetical protein